MEKNGTDEIVTQFQNAFAKVFEDQIQQLIQDSRQEALAQAKKILRESALLKVLEAVADESVNKAELPSKTVVELPVHPSRIKANPEATSISKGAKPADTKNAPPALNDRILEEIEAIREQIRRNERLLSQIKPFVQTSNVKEE